MRLSLSLLLFACCSLAFAADQWDLITVEKDANLLGNEIQFIRQDADKKIWVGSTAGLTLYENGKFTPIVKGPEAYDIYVISPNNYLVGTSNGVVKVVDGKAEKPILGGHRVIPIYKRKNGKFWFFAKNSGTEENKIFAYDGKDVVQIEAFKDLRVTNMFQDSSGGIWIWIDGNGVLEIPADKEAAESVKHLQAKQVSTMFEDSKKRLWCGFWGPGLMVKQDGKWTLHLKQEKAMKFAITEDSKGNIWVATNETGVWVFDGQDWKNHLREVGPVNMIAATSDGKVWISAQNSGGMTCWDGKEWKQSLEGLPIRCLAELSDRKLWAGGVLDGLHVKK